MRGAYMLQQGTIIVLAYFIPLLLSKPSEVINDMLRELQVKVVKGKGNFNTSNNLLILRVDNLILRCLSLTATAWGHRVQT